MYMDDLILGKRGEPVSYQRRSGDVRSADTSRFRELAGEHVVHADTDELGDPEHQGRRDDLVAPGDVGETALREWSAFARGRLGVLLRWLRPARERLGVLLQWLCPARGRSEFFSGGSAPCVNTASRADAFMRGARTSGPMADAIVRGAEALYGRTDPCVLSR